MWLKISYSLDLQRHSLFTCSCKAPSGRLYHWMNGVIWYSHEFQIFHSVLYLVWFTLYTYIANYWSVDPTFKSFNINSNFISFWRVAIRNKESILLENQIWKAANFSKDWKLALNKFSIDKVYSIFYYPFFISYFNGYVSGGGTT